MTPASSSPVAAGEADDRSGAAVVRLADGVELLGQYEGAAYDVPQYLVRRADGQVIQLTALLYSVAAHLDGRHDATGVAAAVSEELGRELSAENVEYLVDQRLRPRGLIDDGAGATPAERASSLLGLTFRKGVVPPRFHDTVTRLLTPLFWPPVVAAVLGSLVAVDVWIGVAGRDGVVDGGRQVLAEPKLLLAASALAVLASAFHELGHAAAARYGGASPGAMGVGIYIVWPVFFTDVTDSYRLSRAGRLRTDLGGIYFNLIVVLGLAAAYSITGYEPLLLLIVIEQFQAAQQLLPFVRLDGYYILSDLVGVPDLFKYMGPALARAVPRRDPEIRRIADAQLAALRPRARRIITAWAFVVVPVLAVSFTILLLLGPRLLAEWRVAVGHHWSGLVGAVRGGEAVGVANAAVDLALVSVPVVGTAVLLWLMGRSIGVPAWRGLRGRPVGIRAVAAAAAIAVVAAVAPLAARSFSTDVERLQAAEQTAGTAADGPPAAPPSPPVIVATVPASSVAATGRGVHIESVDVSRFPHVEITVTVPPLLSRDPTIALPFTVLEEGRERPLTSRPVASGALDIEVLLHDGAPPGAGLGDLRAATTTFLTRLPEAARASVLGAPAQARVDEADRTSVLSAASATPPASPDALVDALLAATTAPPAAPGARRTVVLLSSGGGLGDRDDVEAAAQHLAAAGVVVHPVAVAGEGTDVDALRALAAATGGRAVVVDDGTQLRAAAANLADELASQHVVAFDAEGHGRRHVEVALAGGPGTPLIPAATTTG